VARLVVLLPLLLFAAAASAQFEADSSAPVEITADAMEWFNDEQVAVARGNADAIQGRYHLHADVLTAYLSEGAGGALDRIRRIDAEGSVSLTTPEERARGRTGAYDVEHKKVVLEGAVVLTQGDNVLRGERLVMDLETGRSTLEGVPAAAPPPVAAAGAGRVKAIFSPESER
jgi:lipopolysaccharide export system protein LptA